SVSRLELGLFEGDKQVAHLGVGYAHFKDHKAVLSVRQQAVECPRKSPSESLYFVAMQGGLVLSKLLIERSSVELGEVPLGFDLVHEKWCLVGQASFSSRAAKLMLLLPESAYIEMVEGELTEAPLVVGYRTQMLAGEAKISASQQDVYRIRTGVVSAADQGLVLSGRELYWASKPSLIYAGMPSFRWATGELHAHQGLQLWLSGQPLHELPLSARYGRQSISVKNSQGETLLRKQVGVLPEDFTVELKTSQLPNQGSVIFRTATKCIFRVLDESMTFRRVSTDGAIELQLTAENIPPARVAIEVTFNLMSEPVVLELPFPASGVLAFDCEQKPLARSLTTSGLLGGRLFLFAREDNPVRYDIELRLAANHTTPVGHSWRYTAVDGPLEISLHSMKDEIEALMSLSHDLDHAVELVIKGGGSEVSYRFQHYATNLNIDSDRGVLFSRGEVLRDEATPQPLLILINEPERAPIPLLSRVSEGTKTGEFELPSIIEKNGPWLIVPANQSAVKFRPKFLMGLAQPSELNVEIRTLQQACSAFNPINNPEVFKSVLNNMGGNPEHTGWLFLRTLYKNYSYLPLSTFEVWRALVKHPQALAMALLKFEMSVEFIRQLELDFPLFWEFLPLQCLQDAKQKLAAVLVEKGIPESMVIDLFNKWCAKLAQSLPSYAGDLAKYLSSSTLPQPLPAVVMKMAIDGWYQDLMRNHFEAVWPERFAPQLLTWYRTQTDLPIQLETHSSFHNAVVYMPIFAAAVAAGRANSEDVFGKQPENIFFARQLREFDLDWFGPVFQFCLLSYQKTNESK
ncbi:MAG: STY4851/ECs_5259 family protein, partial [Oceanisphaera sp.]|uniref:STY4851/ECs_5259 family protein n=1 Tax=Oceanisphaera sp. TaxID=1929979 RepID=UPI003F9E249A